MASQIFTYDVPAELLFNDGEGLDFNDLNNAQRLGRRMRDDAVVAARYFIPGSVIGINLRTLFRALKINVSTGMVISVGEGTVLWQLGSDPGQPEARFILAQLESLQNIAVDAAHATLDRWDILSAKAEWSAGNSESRDFEDGVTRAKSTSVLDKRRRAKLTITYTPGTPAASPTEPSIPSGEDKFARIEVPAAAGSLVISDIKDFRFPWGYTRYLIPPKTWWTQTGAIWTFNQDANSRLYWESSNVTQYLNVPLWHPALGHRDAEDMHLRMGRITLRSQFDPAGPSVKIRTRFSNGATVPQDSIDLSGLVDTGGFSARNEIALTGTDPIWMTGRFNPLNLLSGDDPLAFLEVISSTANEQVEAVIVEYFGI